MDNNNKKYTTIICTLIAVITFLVGLIIGMFINANFFGVGGGSNSQTVNTAGEITSGTTENNTGASTDGSTGTGSSTTGSTSSSGERELIYSGYKFTIPADYSVMFQDYGPVVYMNDVFQMRLVVKEEDAATFKAHYDNPSELTIKAVNAGWTITKECKVYTVEGKDYFIFCGNVDGENYVVFRTQIDDKNVFAGNMAVLSSAIDEEDYLNVFSGLARTIEKSDKPDSTFESFYSSSSSGYSGEQRTESTITTKQFSVTYKVPEGLYSSDPTSVFGSGDDPLYYSYNDTYMDTDYDMADVWVRYEGKSAQEYISGHYIAEGNEIKNFKIDGRTFYYVERNRQDDGGNIQQFLIVTELNKDGWIYEVKTYATSKKYDLEQVKKYCEITVK